MSLKSLESTYIYSNLNRSNAVTENMVKLMQNGTKLTSNELEEAFMIINKNFRFPLKFKVMEAFKKGDIQIIYGRNSKLPTCLPFFLTKSSDNKIVAVVVADLYGSFDEENDSVKIDPKKLYCIMESAYLSMLCYERTNELATKAVVLSGGSNIYSMMFTRVLNKKYSLNIDKTKMHKVILLSSMFYLINIMGLHDTNIIFNYAIKNCQNGNIYTLQQTADMFELKHFENLDTFIQAITRPEVGLNLKDLTTRNFLEAFIGMYESSMLLSLESFYYFLYNIMSVTNGAYVNNQYILEDVVGTTGSKIYNELLKLDR